MELVIFLDEESKFFEIDEGVLVFKFYRNFYNREGSFIEYIILIFRIDKY